jgi:hypothetical protein
LIDKQKRQGYSQQNMTETEVRKLIPIVSDVEVSR